MLARRGRGHLLLGRGLGVDRDVRDGGRREVQREPARELLRVPVGAAGNVHLGYGEVKADNVVGSNSAKSKSYSLAYTHALSKRTTAYTGYNRTDNDTGLDFGPVADLDKTVPLRNGGENSDLFVVGVRHTF